MNSFKVLELIGSGSYGKVYKAIHTQTKCIVALKVISVVNVENGVPVEVKYLSKLKECKNVVNLIEHFYSQASNLLIDSSFSLKLADFGFTTYIGNPNLTSQVISLFYRPPELLMGCKNYGPEVDMWSVGCIIVEMLTGCYMFAGSNEENQLDLIFKTLGTPGERSWPGVSKYTAFQPYTSRSKKYPPKLLLEPKFKKYCLGCSQTTMDLILKLLTLNPKHRISCSDALNHPWFFESPSPSPPPLKVLHSIISRPVKLTKQQQQNNTNSLNIDILVVPKQVQPKFPISSSSTTQSLSTQEYLRFLRKQQEKQLQKQQQQQQHQQKPPTIVQLASKEFPNHHQLPQSNTTQNSQPPQNHILLPPPANSTTKSNKQHIINNNQLPPYFSIPRTRSQTNLLGNNNNNHQNLVSQTIPKLPNLLIQHPPPQHQNNSLKFSLLNGNHNNQQQQNYQSFTQNSSSSSSDQYPTTTTTTSTNDKKRNINGTLVNGNNHIQSNGQPITNDIHQQSPSSSTNSLTIPNNVTTNGNHVYRLPKVQQNHNHHNNNDQPLNNYRLNTLFDFNQQQQIFNLFSTQHQLQFNHHLANDQPVAFSTRLQKKRRMLQVGGTQENPIVLE
eukprot:gene7724-9499_t